MEEVYSQSKLAFHPKKLLDLQNGDITPPIYIRFKPTNRCNHRCFYCAYDPNWNYVLSENINRKDELPKEKLIELLNDFHEMGIKAITYTGGGEPLMYTYINDAFKLTLKKGIEMSIITNGQLLDNEKADFLSQAEWVRVSTESIDATTFSKIRRISKENFYKLQKNLKKFAKIKKPECEFGVNFVINHLNANNVFNSAKYFKEIGFNHIKFSPLYTPKNFFEYHSKFKENVIEQINKSKEDLEDNSFKVYSTYEDDFDLSCVNKRTYSRCFMLESLVVVAADCNVYTCQDKAYSNSGLLGSIKNKSFKELWFSEELKDRIKNFNPQKECNHHCTKDKRNLEIGEMLKNLNNLDKYIPSTDKHKNFI